MGWFDDQIKTRIELDDEALDEAFQRIAASITGRVAIAGFDNPDSVFDDVIDEILKFYHVRKVDIPDRITDINEKLDFVLRPSGIMRRVVTLDKGWHSRAFGAMLGTLTGSNTVVALIPSKMGGYYYWDRTTGKKVRINRKNESKIQKEAVAFYKPFPQKELGLTDIILFIKDSLSLSDIALMIIITGICTLIGMLIPIINKLLMGKIIGSGQLDVLVAAVIFLACVTVSKTLFSTITERVNKRMEIRMKVSLEAATIMRVISLPTDFFRNYSSGELSQILSYVNTIGSTLTSIVFQTGLTAVFSIVYVFQIFAYAPGLVVPAFCMILINVVFSVASALINIKVVKNQMHFSTKVSGLSYAMISGIQKIKLSGAESRSFAKWGKTYAESAKVNYNPPAIIKANSAISLAISLGGTLWMYFAAVSNNVSVADYYAFNSLYAMVSAAFLEIATISLNFAGLKPILDIVNPILTTLPETNENKETVTKLSGSIELDNVSFRYTENSPLLLDNLSLKIRPGQYIAIVGKTGCGKSTFLRLLLGFEKPQKGAIYYDGKDINTLDLHSLRRHIGTVIQNGKLFNEDIFSNIAISAPDLTMDQAWEAAEMAGFADDIRKMPMGMFTLLSEDGGGISGGQKQRLMIARAIAPKPKILMLDEATSALDNVTQKKVKESLDGLKCTRIVIAHRLSTIKECNRILVLDHGKIIEDGTYDELMEKNGFFANLIARQNI